MDTLAHGLWVSAAVLTAKRLTDLRIRVRWAMWWAVFPDVLAFGPSFAAGVWLLLVRGGGSVPADGHLLPHAHVGLPLYQLGHSLVVFLLVVIAAAIVARSAMPALLGWPLHIAIDIPTHSLTYHATRFLWPVSDYRIDGLPWWTPWFWAVTYGALAATYFTLWNNGSLPALRRDSCARRRPTPLIASILKSISGGLR